MLTVPSNEVWQYVKCVLPGKFIRDSVPKDFIGRCRTGTLWLALAQIPDSVKENRCSSSTILVSQFRHSEPSSQFWDWWEPSPKPSFFRCQPKANLQAGLSKDSISQSCSVCSFSHMVWHWSPLAKGGSCAMSRQIEFLSIPWRIGTS